QGEVLHQLPASRASRRVVGRGAAAVRVLVESLAGLDCRSVRRASRGAESTREPATSRGRPGARHLRVRAREGKLMPPGHRAAEMRVSSIDVGGQRLRVAIQGGGGARYPLLLLNGLGANLELFQPFIDALDAGIETIRVDLPGAGESPAPSIPLRFRGLASLVVRMLDQLTYGRVDVLGVSWGGALAQQFAHQYRDRCRRLVLVSTGTGAIMVPGRLSALLKMTNARRYQDPSYLASIAGRLYGGRLRSNPELAARFAREVRAGEPQGYFRQMLAAVGWTSIHWLHRLPQPTLILTGRD